MVASGRGTRRIVTVPYVCGLSADARLATVVRMKALSAQRVATALGLAGRPGDPQLELRLLRLFQTDRAGRVDAEPEVTQEPASTPGPRAPLGS
jgi:hypothetical protein